MAEIDAKMRDLESKISEFRKKKEMEMQQKLDLKKAEFEEWERQQRAQASVEAVKRQKQLSELRNKLETLPVEQSGVWFSESKKPATEEDVRKRFEQWARSERKKEWRELLSLDDEARRFRTSVDDMKNRAAKLGQRPGDLPGYSYTAEKLAATEGLAHKKRSDLEGQFFAIFVSEAVREAQSMLSEASAKKSLTSRITALEEGIRIRIDESKTHLNRKGI